MRTLFTLLAVLATTSSYNFTPRGTIKSSSTLDRRKSIRLVVGLVPAFITPDLANASGGATAGKYTTIPIAKRRYYGRVQEAVHEVRGGLRARSEATREGVSSAKGGELVSYAWLLFTLGLFANLNLSLPPSPVPPDGSSGSKG